MDYTKKDKTVVTEEWMDTIAAAAEAGKLPGTLLKTETGPGRPKIFEDDELENITFRIRKSRLSLLDDATSKAGVSRSDFIREAVDEKLGISVVA